MELTSARLPSAPTTAMADTTAPRLPLMRHCTAALRAGSAQMSTALVRGEHRFRQGADGVLSSRVIVTETCSRLQRERGVIVVIVAYKQGAQGVQRECTLRESPTCQA